MVRRKLAIIGNGMATSRLLDDLSRRSGLSMFDVSVFGEEPHGAYNRILLNRVLKGGTVDEITLKPSKWYAEKGVQFYSGQNVARLSHASRRLWTADGREHYFDVAIFATGSLPRVPQVEGLHGPDGKPKQGVFAYRTIDDVEKMRAWAKPDKRAVVVGGGLLGLEAAKGLSDLGMQVTVAHLFDTLMNRQVDSLGGQFLRRAIERLGITVRTSANTRAVLGHSHVEALELGGEEKLPADMVVFTSGVKPRVDLARDSDVPTNSGILVDHRLETLLPGLYAVGECAECDGQVYGTVQPIYEQCAILADVLTGVNPQSRYTGSKVYTKLKVAGVEVASMGAIDSENANDEIVQIIEEKRAVYRKLIIRDGRLAGAVLVGDSSAAAGLVQMFDDRTPLPANRLDILASTDAGCGTSRSNDPEVCNCHHVNTSTLIAEIRAGCDTLPSLSAKTNAGTGCGSCRGQLANLILKNATASRARERLRSMISEVSKRRRVLVFSTTAFTLMFAVWLMFGVLGVPIQKELQLTDIQLGWLGAAAILAGALPRLMFGVWADLYGGRMMMTILLLITAVPTFWVSRATSYEELFCCALVFGLAGNGFTVGIAWNAAWFPKQQQGLALGVFGAGNVGASVTKLIFGLFGAVLLTAIPVGGLFGGLLPDGWRFYPALYSVLLIGMATAVWFWRRIQTTRLLKGELTVPSLLL